MDFLHKTALCFHGSLATKYTRGGNAKRYFYSILYRWEVVLVTAGIGMPKLTLQSWVKRQVVEPWRRVCEDWASPSTLQTNMLSRTQVRKEVYANTYIDDYVVQTVSERTRSNTWVEVKELATALLTFLNEARNCVFAIVVCLNKLMKLCIWQKVCMAIDRKECSRVRTNRIKCETKHTDE